jgi:hypothetical protein
MRTRTTIKQTKEETCHLIVTVYPVVYVVILLRDMYVVRV